MAAPWRLPAVLGVAGLLAWGGAEALLHWRGLPSGGPPPARSAGSAPDKPASPAPPALDKDGQAAASAAAAAAAAAAQAAREAAAAIGPGKTAEPAPYLPRVVTPDGTVARTLPALRGPTRVGDGDSLEVGGMRVRLVGIDAPELHQTCRDRVGQTVACGQLARAALEALARAGPVSCTPLDTDRFDRVLAVCGNGREEINRAMVQAGWAFAYEGDPSYLPDEQAAARAGRGIHALQYERPAAWRRANPR